MSGDDLTPERVRYIEAAWKSDVDLKLDRLIRFADTHEPMMKVIIERELSRKKLRDAVIEKTLAGLVWAGIVFLAMAVWHWLKTNLSSRWTL